MGSEHGAADGDAVRSIGRPDGAVRVVIAGACATAVCLLSAGVAVAVVDGQKSIRFLQVAQPAQDRLVDHNRNRRPDPGDSVLATSSLYRWAGSQRGPRLGRLQSVCVLATRRTANCTGTFFLPGGTVQAQGYTDFDHGVDELAVIGGTGTYSGVQGTFTSQALGGPDSGRSVGTIRLIR